MSDDLRHALKRLMGLAPDAWKDCDVIKDHIAALEKERDAALADNAALVEHARTERQMLSMLYHRIKAMGLRNEAMADAVTTVERWMDAVPDTYEQPHPGAALLEKHRKKVERFQAMVAEAEGNLDLAEADHRKALVRARNEGLEEAVREVSHVKAKYGTDTPVFTALDYAEDRIRAMKEPESD